MEQAQAPDNKLHKTGSAEYLCVLRMLGRTRVLQNTDVFRHLLAKAYLVFKKSVKGVQVGVGVCFRLMAASSRRACSIFVVAARPSCRCLRQETSGILSAQQGQLPMVDHAIWLAAR